MLRTTIRSLAFVALLAAGAALAQDVRYWHTMSDAETEALGRVIAAFEADHPGITVAATRYAYNDFRSALLTSLAGGQAPETARLDIIWVPAFAEIGALVPLDEAMPDFDEIAAAMFAGPLATNVWDGHTYGLPQDTNTQVLLWSPELFAAAGVAGPPATLAEFRDAACALSEGDTRYGYALGGTYFWAPAPIFYAMGGAVTDPEIQTAQGYLNGPASVAAFEMLADMYGEGCISPNLLGGGIGTAQGHGSGLYAMIIDGPWMVDIYAADFPDFDVHFAPVPAGPDGSTSSVVGGQNVVAFEGGAGASDATLAWIRYLTSPEAQLEMAAVGVIPVRADLAGDARLPDYFDVFLDQLATAQARVPHPDWPDMDNAIGNAFQRVLLGQQTPREALDQAAAEVDALLGN
jgi:multiple sugar transport system substrate-binding protein